MIPMYAAAEISVAIITTVGVLVTAILAFINGRFLRKNVGTTNGRGTLTTMVEDTLLRQGALRDDVKQLSRASQILKRDLTLTKNAVDQHDATDSIRFERIENMLRTRDERAN